MVSFFRDYQKGNLYFPDIQLLKANTLSNLCWHQLRSLSRAWSYQLCSKWIPVEPWLTTYKGGKVEILSQLN